jgi:hypothetical protein
MEGWFQGMAESFVRGLGLEGLVELGGNWNFRCPVCGDSATDKRRRRGYLLKSKTNDQQNPYIFYCHNCNASLPFRRFLDEVSPDMARDWTLALARAGFQGKVRKSPGIDAQVIWRAKDTGLQKCSELPGGHEAVAYLESRHVPREAWKWVRWAPDFKDLVDSSLPPGRYPRIWIKSGIVWELRSMDGSLLGWLCRTIDPEAKKTKRFMKCVSADGGFARIGIKSPAVVVEGPMDMMMFPDAVAACNAALARLDFPEAVLFYDQEPRNHAVCAQIEKAVAKGRRVCIMPPKYTGMDPNEIGARYGLGHDAMLRLVVANSWTGLAARVKLAGFRMDV